MQNSLEETAGGDTKLTQPKCLGKRLLAGSNSGNGLTSREILPRLQCVATWHAWLILPFKPFPAWLTFWFRGTTVTQTFHYTSNKHIGNSVPFISDKSKMCPSTIKNGTFSKSCQRTVGATCPFDCDSHCSQLYSYLTCLGDFTWTNGDTACFNCEYIF